MNQNRYRSRPPGEHMALARLVEAARKHGKRVAMIADGLESAREMIAMGATIINYSSDTAVLRSGYAAAVDALRAAAPGR